MPRHLKANMQPYNCSSIIGMDICRHTQTHTHFPTLTQRHIYASACLGKSLVSLTNCQPVWLTGFPGVCPAWKKVCNTRTRTHTHTHTHSAIHSCTRAVRPNKRVHPPSVSLYWLSLHRHTHRGRHTLPLCVLGVYRKSIWDFIINDSSALPNKDNEKQW